MTEAEYEARYPIIGGVYTTTVDKETVSYVACDIHKPTTWLLHLNYAQQFGAGHSRSIRARNLNVTGILSMSYYKRIA